MRFSEAKKHKVVSTSSASTVGKVSGYVVDPAARQVIALRLKKTEGDADLLPWSALKAFGRDAVTVESADAIVVAEGRIAELTGKEHEVLGKRMLTEAGDELGEVKDVEFDPESGAVTALLTKTDEVKGDRLRGVGSYAVVVRTS